MPKKDAVRSLSTIHALLGSEIRLAVIRELGRGPRRVNMLAEAVQRTESAVSQHLQRLLALGVAEKEPDGQHRVYRLTSPVHPVIVATLALLD